MRNRKKYPVTDLKRERGLPFVMVFLYAPWGTHIFTGDLGTIRTHLENHGTCHGVVIYYSHGTRVGHRIEIFGKGAMRFRKNSYLSFVHASKKEAANPMATRNLKELAHHLDERKKFLLVEHTTKLRPHRIGNYGGRETQLHETQLHVLGKWRSIPKTYLSVFKEYDATM